MADCSTGTFLWLDVVVAASVATAVTVIAEMIAVVAAAAVGDLAIAAGIVLRLAAGLRMQPETGGCGAATNVAYFVRYHHIPLHFGRVFCRVVVGGCGMICSLRCADAVGACLQVESSARSGDSSAPLASNLSAAEASAD